MICMAEVSQASSGCALQKYEVGTCCCTLFNLSELDSKWINHKLHPRRPSKTLQKFLKQCLEFISLHTI